MNKLYLDGYSCSALVSAWFSSGGLQSQMPNSVRTAITFECTLLTAPEPFFRRCALHCLPQQHADVFTVHIHVC